MLRIFLCFNQLSRGLGSKVLDLTKACAAHARINPDEYLEPQFFVLQDPKNHELPEYKDDGEMNCWKGCVSMPATTEINDILSMCPGTSPKIIVDFGKKFVASSRYTCAEVGVIGEGDYGIREQ